MVGGCEDTSILGGGGEESLGKSGWTHLPQQSLQGVNNTEKITEEGEYRLKHCCKTIGCCGKLQRRYLVEDGDSK